MEKTDFAAGALRFKDDEGLWHIAEPRNALYSTVSMLATERWDVELKQWVPLFEDEGD